MLRVLLVEDNRGDVELVKRVLKAQLRSYDLWVAADFEQACDYIDNIAAGPEDRCPDVLLLDLNLPQGSGHDILRLFRNQPHCQAVPVIVVSSSNDPKDREEAARLGAAHYFPKPFDIDEFMKLGPLLLSLVDGSHLGSSQG